MARLDISDQTAAEVLRHFTAFVREHPVSNGDYADRNLEAMTFALEKVADEQSSGAVLFELSGRQYDVLRLLSEGKVYKEIALELELSPSTVRTHLHHVYKTLGVSDRAQAALAFKEGQVVRFKAANDSV